MRYVIKTNRGYLMSGTWKFEYTNDIYKAKNFSVLKNAQKWANEALHSDWREIEFAKVVGITINEVEL